MNRAGWTIIALGGLLAVTLAAFVLDARADPPSKPPKIVQDVQDVMGVEHNGEAEVKAKLKGVDEKIGLIQLPDGSYRFVLHTSGGNQLVSPEQFAQRVHNEQRTRGWLEIVLNISSPIGVLWVVLGFGGQIVFTGRMIVQWLVSEKKGRSVVPPVFWWMSLVGATMLIVYFGWRKDIVGILGQATGWMIYVRNLWMIHKPNGQSRQPAEDPAPEPELG